MRRSRLLQGLRRSAIGLLLLAAIPFATAAAPPDAQLSITLRSGVETVAPGDALTYTAEIRSTGETVDARVVLEPPAYITLGDAEAATVDDNRAEWSVLLHSGSTTTLEIPARVGEIPAGELRATAVIGVYVGDATAPLVRTAVADRIEGVEDEQTVRPATGTIVFWAGVAAVVVLAALSVTLLVVRRRRR